MLGHGSLAQDPLGGIVDSVAPLRGGYSKKRDHEQQKFRARLREQRRRYEERLRREEEERRIAAQQAEARRQAEVERIAGMLADLAQMERARQRRDDQEAAFLLMVA